MGNGTMEELPPEMVEPRTPQTRSIAAESLGLYSSAGGQLSCLLVRQNAGGLGRTPVATEAEGYR